VAGAITPVPGVGPMTIAICCSNTVMLAEQSRLRRRQAKASALSEVRLGRRAVSCVPGAAFLSAAVARTCSAMMAGDAVSPNGRQE
jgi:hypothetical protein